MLDPIVKTIEVPCGQDRAFDIFVREMGAWWPLDRRSMSMHAGATARALHVEPQKGGRIVEISDDGTEHHWGTFTAFDPHDALAMDFHMGLPPENASRLEVRFAALGAELTRVELTQSNWEAFGDMAEMMYRGYGSGWVIIFEEAYKRACGG